MDNTLVDDRKKEAIELLIKGENIIDIATRVGVSRGTIYNWLNNEDFKAELEKSKQALRNQIDNKLLISVEPLLDKLIKIALKSKSDKTSLDACVYALNRICGTPIQQSKDMTENKEGINKVIDLDTIKNAIVNVDKKEIVEAEIVQDTDNNPADDKTE